LRRAGVNAVRLRVLAGSDRPALAEAVARRLGTALTARVLEHFPDGETHLELREEIAGDDVYLVQAAGPPVGEHLLELSLLADACRRAGAARVTAVVPYLGYARQDRRTRAGAPLGARVVAGILDAAGLDRLVAVDLHTPALAAAFAVPVEHLTAAPLLAAALAPERAADGVVVSPDLGGVKLAERYARLLGLPLAAVRKTRVSGAAVEVCGLMGEVRDRTAIVVDDMISTGGTIEAAGRALLEAGARPPITVVATHALLVGSAAERLARLPIGALHATDSVVPAAPPPGVVCRTTSLAPLLADAVGRCFAGRSLEGLLAG
jgi:ribose-phosphate pyrophosphokinase